ncbi:MAG: NADH-quinone oxidoreductase subunit NuoN [Gammaproteobacteria bacterium]|nr:NADH-quinone oxidoreductase subunit NuoN [Gammaproteobacteria bacterium]
MNLTELHLLLPEIFVLSMGCIILLVDAYIKDSTRSVTYQFSQATLAGAAALTIYTAPAASTLALHGTFINDGMSVLLKSFIYLVTFVVFLYSREYLRQRNILKGEFFILGLFAVLGMQIMASAHNLLTIYLGLELLSLSLYAMIAMNRDSQQAAEAAMKYFVLGALASGMLLYGMSILYGVTGSLDLTEISQAVSTKAIEGKVLAFALVFIVVGLAFKFGAVPFHMWVPDVYQGSPTAATVFISTAPKLAAFAMLMRLLVDGMGSLSAHWQDMLILLAVLSMAIGNIVAVAQTNIKRMLAYSTISHVGFLVLGVLTVTQDGYAASMFYTIVYALMSLGGFGVILLLSRAGFEADKIEDFKGLNERSPWYAFIMLILMLSMAGVPPLLGFWAKLAVLKLVVAQGMVWLAVTAVFFSVIGAFYYLRIVWFMYFDKAADDTPPVSANIDMRLALSANGLIILALGLFPQTLMQACLGALS